MSGQEEVGFDIRKEVGVVLLAECGKSEAVNVMKKF